MHMADALLSPEVGLTFAAASAAAIAFSAKKVSGEFDEKKIPLMGVLGAFVFAAQMINFTIPGTGSSGHIGGGMLLTMILGPYAAFLTLASVLIVQSLFFADGGVLALGTNIFNLGVFPCFLGWLIYRYAGGRKPGSWRLTLTALLGVLIGLELGAFGVVIQTLLSGKSELPFSSFTGVMLGIHFPIAIVEGLITAAVVNFVFTVRPEIANSSMIVNGSRTRPYMPILVSLLGAALITGTTISWFASSHPDGLEWSIEKIYGSDSLEESSSGIFGFLSGLQQKTAFLPDYAFKGSGNPGPEGEDEAAWPAFDKGTSMSGLVGSFLTLALIALVGAVLIRVRKKTAES